MFIFNLSTAIFDFLYIDIHDLFLHIKIKLSKHEITFQLFVDIFILFYYFTFPITIPSIPSSTSTPTPNPSNHHAVVHVHEFSLLFPFSSSTPPPIPLPSTALVQSDFSELLLNLDPPVPIVLTVKKQHTREYLAHLWVSPKLFYPFRCWSSDLTCGCLKRVFLILPVVAHFFL